MDLFNNHNTSLDNPQKADVFREDDLLQGYRNPQAPRQSGHDWQGHSR